MADKTRLIIGLGNPGKNYELTRHNIGFQVIDKIKEDHNFPVYQKKFHAEFSEQKIENVKIILFKPQTYMNRSGIAVLEIKTFYKIHPQNILVIYDDLDLALGKIKIKVGGSSGGHNGIKSLDNFIGSNYVRVRLGISKPYDKHQVNDFVLGEFGSNEIAYANLMKSYLSENLRLIISENYDKMLNDYAIELRKLENKNGS